MIYLRNISQRKEFKQMAKKKTFTNSIFIDEYEMEIEQVIKRNIERLDDDISINKSHIKIVDILKQEKQTENKYLNMNEYRNFINKVKHEKKIKAETRAENTQDFTN